jgi:hypothetical protein
VQDAPPTRSLLVLLLGSALRSNTTAFTNNTSHRRKAILRQSCLSPYGLWSIDVRWGAALANPAPSQSANYRRFGANLRTDGTI